LNRYLLDVNTLLALLDPRGRREPGALGAFTGSARVLAEIGEGDMIFTEPKREFYSALERYVLMGVQLLDMLGDGIFFSVWIFFHWGIDEYVVKKFPFDGFHKYMVIVLQVSFGLITFIPIFKKVRRDLEAIFCKKSFGVETCTAEHCPMKK
jgi:hypothetical protein